MAVTAVRGDALRSLLSDLLGRDVTVSPAAAAGMLAHPATLRGLVSDQDRLVAVIGSDLDFALQAAAALAMIPAGRLDELDYGPDAELLATYTEVANVMSRLLNEASPARLRLDPSIVHDQDQMEELIDDGTLLMCCTVSIDGYGHGMVSAWWREEAVEPAPT